MKITRLEYVVDSNYQSTRIILKWMWMWKTIVYFYTSIEKSIRTEIYKNIRIYIYICLKYIHTETHGVTRTRSNFITLDYFFYSVCMRTKSAVVFTSISVFLLKIFTNMKNLVRITSWSKPRRQGNDPKILKLQIRW